MAEYTINVNEYVNQPPSSVGDGEQTIDYGEVIVFTRAMLTSALSPAYADPEGDAANLLKIIQLPSIGLLKLNGTNVLVNDEIKFSDIDLSLLTFVPDNSTTSSYASSFQFAIADVGSGVFVGTTPLL